MDNVTATEQPSEERVREVYAMALAAQDALLWAAETQRWANEAFPLAAEAWETGD